MNYTLIEILGTVFFAMAILHTFVVSRFLQWSHHFPKASFANQFLHLLAEVEVVFALWAGLFMMIFVGLQGWQAAINYQNSLNFTEPFFVFAIMVLCSTRPILTAARGTIRLISQGLQSVFKTPAVPTDLIVVMVVGPLSGSFITEPAAMTVTAFLLNSMLKSQSVKVLYPLLAVLFVNVSIGGALTPFAAPPILMVAVKWNWDLAFVFANFGWKSALAVLINGVFLVLFLRQFWKTDFQTLSEVETKLASAQASIPFAVIFVHLLFLVGIVMTSHYQNAFLGLFLLFLGVATVTQRYQDALRLKESLLVALFLGGIIQFGAFQKWWLAPLLSQMTDLVLFKGAVLLTAVTDNAALTYLGSQVEDLSARSQYALVAGAIAGGGLTIIANAPNAAGYSILQHRFEKGLRPLHLLVAALVPTLVAILCLWFF